MRRTPILLFTAAAIIGACSRATTTSTTSMTPSVPRPAPEGATISGDVSLNNSPPMVYPSNAAIQGVDPRIGLKPGAAAGEAGEAAWNLKLTANRPAPPSLSGRGATGSDLAFTGNYAVQGNYRGFTVWDLANPRDPKMVVAYLCPASQGDPTIYRNLLFISGESQGSRNDCGTTPITDSVSLDRFRGIRIFDISNIAQPKLVTNVQTCRGSHTNTVVQDPKDKDNIYIYVSGYSQIRSEKELAGCKPGLVGDSTGAAFRIEIIKVPLRNPERSAVVNSPHLLDDLSGRTVHAPPPSDTGGGGRGGRAGAPAPGAPAAGAPAGAPAAAAGGGRGGRGGRGGGINADSIIRARNLSVGPRGVPLSNGVPLRGADSVSAVQALLAGGGRGGVGQSGCHDITAYPSVGYAGGACGGYGLLFDVRDTKNPKRLKVVSDSNMSFWHSATFSNDGSKVLFSDEWGGGGQPRCRATDPKEWGGNAIFTVENGELKFKSYYKMPAPQTTEETCTAHNGSLIPVPGRDIMVQAFYQGGATIFDWTDPAKPIEIAFFDRGPGQGSGYWSTYWYNGMLVSSDEGRGLDVAELTPSAYLSQNEIDAAKTVRYEQFNSQEQPHTVWPPSFALARAYLDQMERNRGLPQDRINAIRNELKGIEAGSCSTRESQLLKLSTGVKGDAGTAADKGRVELVVRALAALAKAGCGPVVP